METYINEWVDADGRRHILYMPLSLDELPLGDFYSQALEIIVEEPRAPLSDAPKAQQERRSLSQHIRGWFSSSLPCKMYAALDAQD